MNVLVGSMFALLFVIAAFMAMGEQIWQKAHVYDDWYLQYNNKYPDFYPSFRGWVLGVSGAGSGGPVGCTTTRRSNLLGSVSAGIYPASPRCASRVMWQFLPTPSRTSLAACTGCALGDPAQRRHPYLAVRHPGAGQGAAGGDYRRSGQWGGVGQPGKETSDARPAARGAAQGSPATSRLTL